MFSPTLAVGILLLVLLHLVRNHFAVSVSIPGPFVARFTDLWRAYRQYRGKLRHDLEGLHARHGPLVRYGVRSVSISDPSAIDVIYGSRAGFVVADSYTVLIGISNGMEVPSLVSTVDEVRHGQLRRSIAGAFTTQGAQEYERYVDATVPDLLDYIRKREGKQIDLPDLMMLYSMDSAMRMAFDESLGCLQAGSDVGSSIALIRGRFRHWGRWSSVPWLERLVYRNPWAMRQSKDRPTSAMVTTAVKKLQERLQDEPHESVDMLDKFIAAHKSNPDIFDMQGIVSTLMSTISGAGDTTATTMTAVMYYLMQHPAEMKKVRIELAEAGVEQGQVPPSTVTNTLPYLAAVIKESMRLFPASTWPIERLVPAGGIILAGRKIREGTSVGVFVPSLHLNEEVFGKDATQFRPQRWMDASEKRSKTMERAFMGFSRGRKVCLGQHVALMQMKKVLPVLIMTFDMTLVRPDAGLEADMSFAVASLKPLWVVTRPSFGTGAVVVT